MKLRNGFIAAILFGIALGLLSQRTYGVAHAQTTITPAKCNSPVQTVVTIGTTAAPCPTAQTEGRRWVGYTLSPLNAGTPKLRIRIDGTAADSLATAAAPGDILTTTNPFSGYYLSSAVAPSCRADTAGTLVLVTECK